MTFRGSNPNSRMQNASKGEAPNHAYLQINLMFTSFCLFVCFFSRIYSLHEQTSSDELKAQKPSEQNYV